VIVRISLKAINSELERRGSQAVLAKGDGYFYFWGGEAADWLDRTVRVPTLRSRTLDQWMQEFQKLRETNRKLMQSIAAPPDQKASQAGSRRKTRGAPKRSRR
jgi:hypothetical protein